MKNKAIFTFTFATSKPGTDTILNGVATAINPQHHIVIRNPADFLCAIWQFRKATLICGLQNHFGRHNFTQPIAVIINTGGATLRRLATKTLKKALSPSFTIQIGCHFPSSSMYDLIVMPPGTANKKVNPGKIVNTITLPTPVTQKLIDCAREQWTPILKNGDRKLLSVIIGGNISGGDLDWHMSIDYIDTLVKKVTDLAKKYDCNIVMTTSRRKPSEVTSYLKKKIAPYCIDSYFYGEKKINPYWGYVACADAIVISWDSISMISELAATRAPLYGLGADDAPQASRELLFYDYITQVRRVAPLSSSLEFGERNPISANPIVRQHILKALSDKLALD